MTYQPNPDMFKVEKRAVAYKSACKKSWLRSPNQNVIVTVAQDGKEIVANKSVSDRYEIHQPADTFAAFNEIATKAGLEVGKPILNPHNGGILINAKYQDLQIIGDDHDINVVFFASHDGTKRTFLTLQALRLQCMNQAPILYKERDMHMLSEKHYANALDLNRLQDLLLGVPESVNMYNARSEQLADTKMTQADFVEFYLRHAKIAQDSKQYDSKIERAIDAYNHNDNAAIESGTAYKAFHAITFLNSHKVADGGALRDSKFTDKQSITTRADDTQRAMDSLLKLAA